LKPTSAYGPLSFVTALVFFLYLYYLYSLSPYRLSLASGSVSVAAGYSVFLEILMIVPIVEMVAAVFTTIEDAVSPKERLLFDYPA
jgi:glucan phosphoethanolaminetransferase (alkaline phosphatase superfamily)